MKINKIKQLLVFDLHFIHNQMKHADTNIFMTIHEN